MGMDIPPLPPTSGGYSLRVKTNLYVRASGASLAAQEAQ